MNSSEQSFREVYESYISAKTARGVSEITIRNYRQHLHSISKYIDLDMPHEQISKGLLENMIISMRESGLAHNSIATYVRTLRAFLAR